MSRDELVSGLVRIGEMIVTGEDQAEIDAYFAPDFTFHGPDGGESNYEGLQGYFAALRAAFENLTIKRGIVVVEGQSQRAPPARSRRALTIMRLHAQPHDRPPGDLASPGRCRVWLSNSRSCGSRASALVGSRNTAGMVTALVLIGAPGAGKSSVLEELATLHDIEALEHGAIEAEQLSLGRPLLPASSWVPQLDAVLSLQRESGRRRFLISATVETAEDLTAVRTATAAELTLVVCLSASSETVAARIDLREPDRWPGKAPLIARARQLASSTPCLPGIDLIIDTEQRTAEDVAAEILQAMRPKGMLGSR